MEIILRILHKKERILRLDKRIQRMEDRVIRPDFHWESRWNKRM